MISSVQNLMPSGPTQLPSARRKRTGSLGAGVTSTIFSLSTTLVTSFSTVSTVGRQAASSAAPAAMPADLRNALRLTGRVSRGDMLSSFITDGNTNQAMSRLLVPVAVGLLAV